jgi:hypothetical protein
MFSTARWTQDQGNVKRLEGRNLFAVIRQGFVQADWERRKKEEESPKKEGKVESSSGEGREDSEACNMRVDICDKIHHLGAKAAKSWLGEREDGLFQQPLV